MTPEITINGRKIGIPHPAYFIADIAASHDGDLEKAKALIYSAAEMGADAAKFQNFQAETIISDYGFKALGNQQSHQASWGKSVFEVYQDASIPLEWTPILKKTCDDAGIDFFTSPYSLDLVEAVSEYVCAWKVGSGDVTWHENIIAMCKDGKPFMMATGACDMNDVQDAVKVVSKYHDHFVLMQCNTNYTAHLNETPEQQYTRFACINLKVLETYKNAFPQCILGLSDHTHGPDTVLGAIGLYDARVIEKHYTLDNEAEGPDHPFSMNPETWKEMMQKTREIENKIDLSMGFEERLKVLEKHTHDFKALKLSLGDGIKRIEKNEHETVVLQRRAVRAKKSLKAGDILHADDTFPLRPAPQSSIVPYKINAYIGKTIKKNIEAGEHLTDEHFA